MNNLNEIIKSRKSVRTYDEKPVSDEHRKMLEEYAKEITGPFEIPVEFVFIDAKEHGLSSPVLTGESLYVAGIVKKKPYA